MSVNVAAGKVHTAEQGGVLVLVVPASSEDPITLCLIFIFNIWLFSKVLYSWGRNCQQTCFH